MYDIDTGIPVHTWSAVEQTEITFSHRDASYLVYAAYIRKALSEDTQATLPEPLLFPLHLPLAFASKLGR